MTEPTRVRRRDRLRFLLERIVLRGLHTRLLLAAAIVAGVALLGGLALVLSDPDPPAAGDAVWWAFLRLTDPGYLGDDEGIARRLISTVVTVLGYLLFLGLLIAILTQWLNQTISKLESGVTPVALRDHVIVLGWTERTPALVSELLRTGNRVERFLARHGARKLRIVILSDAVDAQRIQHLRDFLGELWDDQRVFLRAGSALRVEHLERVAYRDAAVLILPGAGFGERNPDSVDAETVKTLMSISRHAQASQAIPPLAVAELYDASRAEYAQDAYAGKTEVVAGDDTLSRLFVQSVRDRGVGVVFNELLTLNEGNAVHVRKLERGQGLRFGELRSAFPAAIPIGLVRPDAGGALLDPDPDTALGDGELVVFIARRFDDCSPQATPGESGARGVPPQRPVLPSRRRVLVLGWSRKAPQILREFARYGTDAFEVDVVSSTPTDERQRMIERHAPDAPAGAVRHIEAGYTARGVLASLDPAGYDDVVLLSSERLDDEEGADAATAFAFQILSSLLPKKGKRPDVFVELLDEANAFLFPREVAEALVSPMLVSYLLSQVALLPELGDVFAELTRPWGPQIVLRPARDDVEGSEPVLFDDVAAAAAQRGEIALGFWRPGEADGGLALNPDRRERWTFRDGDTVVVLAVYAEPDQAA